MSLKSKLVFQQKKRSWNGIGWHWLPKWHDRGGAQRIERIPELAWILVRWGSNQCHRSVLVLLLSNNLLKRYYFWLIGWLIFVLQQLGRDIGHVSSNLLSAFNLLMTSNDSTHYHKSYHPLLQVPLDFLATWWHFWSCQEETSGTYFTGIWSPFSTPLLIFPWNKIRPTLRP